MASVSVDDNFARFGGKSYAINKINSVEVRSRNPHGGGAALFWGLLSLIFALAGLFSLSEGDGSSLVSIGLAFLFGWFAYGSWQRSKIVEYQLFLMTSSSEAQAFVTRSRDEVDALRNRIEQAMAAS